MYDCVLNTPLAGFAQDPPRVELTITPVVESLTTTTWQKCHQNKLAVRSTTDTLLKNKIFVEAFLIEDYEYNALRKELLVAPFIEHFKTTTLRKPYW